MPTGSRLLLHTELTYLRELNMTGTPSERPESVFGCPFQRWQLRDSSLSDGQVPPHDGGSGGCGHPRTTWHHDKRVGALPVPLSARVGSLTASLP